MLGAIAVMGKVINVLFFSALSVLGRKKEPEDLPPVEAPPVAAELLPVPEPEEVGWDKFEIRISKS